MSFLKPKSVTEVNDYSPLIFFGKMGLFMNDPNAPLQGRKEAWGQCERTRPVPV